MIKKYKDTTHRGLKHRQIPSPVQVRKGKWGYNVWIFKCEEFHDGCNYFHYELAVSDGRKFIRKQDAIKFGYARIYKEKCPLFFMPMRRKPKQSDNVVPVEKVAYAPLCHPRFPAILGYTKRNNP